MSVEATEKEMRNQPGGIRENNQAALAKLTNDNRGLMKAMEQYGLDDAGNTLYERIKADYLETHSFVTKVLFVDQRSGYPTYSDPMDFDRKRLIELMHKNKGYIGMVSVWTSQIEAKRKELRQDHMNEKLAVLEKKHLNRRVMTKKVIEVSGDTV